MFGITDLPTPTLDLAASSDTLDFSTDNVTDVRDPSFGAVFTGGLLAGDKLRIKDGLNQVALYTVTSGDVAAQTITFGLSDLWLGRRRLSIRVERLVGDELHYSPYGEITIDVVYNNSITSTSINYIHSDDPDTFLGVTYLGLLAKEMPGDTPANLFQNAYVFRATFSDSTPIDLYCDVDYGSEAAALLAVNKFTGPLGKLPTIYKNNLKYLVIHPQDGGFYAESAGHFIICYEARADVRIAENDLEETIFHEATHAAIQQAGGGLGFNYLASAAWAAAVAADGNAAVTEYALSENQERFAEHALFAWTLMNNPTRLGSDAAQIAAAIPNQIAFFQTIFNGGTP